MTTDVTFLMVRKPGDRVSMEVELQNSHGTAMDKGLRFAMREGGTIIGCCAIVSEILE
jgi:translation elongation factor EF-Tu-like GTPase